MVKVALFCFSGTGNTRRAAECAVSSFRALGCDATLFSMETTDANAFDLDGYDLIGFAYPIHAFNAPKNVVRFARALPKSAERKRAFVFKTSGEPLAFNRASSALLSSVLRKKNVRIENEYHLVMPYNMVFRHTEENAFRMWETAQKLIPIGTYEITKSVPCPPGRLLFKHTFAFLMRIEHWGARVLGKRFRATDGCVGCGLCAKNCPTGNIVMKDGKPEFGKNCVLCVRCSFFCPKNAIRISLLENWKVNGAYAFALPEEPSNDEHRKFCRRAYAKYYRRAEEKIAKYDAIDDYQNAFIKQ